MVSFEVLTKLKNATRWKQDIEEYVEKITAEKKDHKKKNDESALFRCWQAITFLEVIRKYKEAFTLLKSRQYKKGWDKLEETEIDLHNLVFNNVAITEYPPIASIDATIRKYQSIFPYRIFGSPEMLNEKVECTICGSDMNPFTGCKHIPGRVYGGEICLCLVHEAKFISLSMVTHPVQKYSAMYDDIDNPKRYQLLEYLMPMLDNEYIRWDYRLTERFHPHSEYNIGRNDKCPCESGKKYKLCCLNDSRGVKYPHYEFLLPDDIIEKRTIQQSLQPESAP